MKTAVATADNFGEKPLENISAFLGYADWYAGNHPEQRRGQAYMNFLAQCGDIGQELYDMATGSMFDPFYADVSDPKLKTFVGWLSGFLGRG